MTSATDELRKLLDERGVEHYDGTEYTLWLKDGEVYRASANEGLNGLVHLHFWCTTPEQAVEATLGREKCRNIGYGLRFECSTCHQTVGGDMPNFCPNCGREVER